MDPITSKEDVKYYLGTFYFQEKNYKKAIKIYKEGLTLNPQSTLLLYEIGLAYARLKNYKEAIKHWRKVVKIAPGSYLGIEAKWKLNKIKSSDR